MERAFNYRFGDIYNNYVAKVQRKGKDIEHLDDVLGWLTGLSSGEIHAAAESDATLREFFDDHPLNPSSQLITGVVCGVRVEEIEDPLMRAIRYMDKVVDELARGKKVGSIKRGEEAR
ncbi:hypothetical protein CAPI_07285 [Corynebacterium capitovis DSM 44611]|uniref:DUF2200 family protein n=1 Tax=Corynebacterium capitovis TaxID=131081 RepID=UPI000377AC76|nr:DUF2200 family protein [Corynebacterium capitovis]WKD57995.1 hypothetical protein CAPI_07285 [Corynebacterium capitovis DSM 44611]